MEQPKNPVTEAERLIQGKEPDKAHAILTDLVAKVPDGWKPVTESPEELLITFWDMQEFMSYVAHHKDSGDKRNVAWFSPSYSKAYYLLAYIAIERRDADGALAMLDKGLALEPDHPMLMCEKAMLMQTAKRFQDALELYQKAMSARDWAPAAQKARAMRGAAVALIDLKRLDEAESLLKGSLELEPGNRLALNELGYIEKLRGSGD